MSEWKSTKGSGKVWNPTKDENSEPRYHATDDDVIEGTYKSIREGVGENNASVYTIEVDGGECYDIWGTKTLNDGMQQARIGNLVRIVWHGKKLTKDGATKFKSVEKCTNTKMAFHDYEVFVKEGSYESSSPAPANKPANAGVNAPPRPKAPAPMEEDNGLPF